MGFGGRSVLVAHRRHRRRHHGFLCAARRYGIVVDHLVSRGACADVDLPRLHLRIAAGQAPRLRPRLF